jgi:hypothetical protein
VSAGGAHRTVLSSRLAAIMAILFAEYRDTPLWRALADALTELEATGEVKVETAPDYVIGYLCRELAVKWVVASSALTRER